MFAGPGYESYICADRPYRFLALEGGGVKGLAYGGAAAALEHHGLLAGLEGFSGTYILTLCWP